MTSETHFGRAGRLVGVHLEGRYRVDSLIARGGMSAVYRGMDTRLQRPVAIKVMDSQFSADPSFVDRFEGEARAAAQLHHPSVVAVYDQGVDTDSEDIRVYLVMQLVEGCTLRDILRDNGRLPPAVAFTVLAPMLSALSAAHDAGMVHRDVKPENVLIGQDGMVRVADFGLVRAAASAGTTSANVILGTVAYLSPEQVTTGAADARTDLYAAGIVLYEMLTGQPPYVGDTALSVAYRHVNDDVPAPSELVPELPPAIDDLVLRATRRDPSQRPESAAALLAQLQWVRGELGLPDVAVPVPASEQRTAWMAPVQPDPPTAGMAASGAAMTGGGPRGTRAMPRPDLPPPRPITHIPPDSARRPGRRRFAGWLVLMLVLAALVGGGAWWLGAGRFTTVPVVNGRSELEASQALQQARLVPNIVGRHDDSVPQGIVIGSSPGQGSHVPSGRQVDLVVSLGLPQVPGIAAGTSVGEAESALRDAMLQPRLNAAADQYSPTVTKGTVLAIEPAAGTRVRSNSPVTLILSKGPQPVHVPDVRGMSHDEAFAALRNAGFNPYDEGSQFSSNVDGGHVISTDPSPGTLVSLAGSPRIGLVVSNAVTVPTFTGMQVQQAQQTAASLGLSLDVQSFFQRQNGTVFGQFPLAGTRVQPGSVVHATAF